MTTRSSAAGLPAPTRVSRSIDGLRLSRRRWEDIDVDGLSVPAMIVVGAWVLLAWARFGSQAIAGVRVFTRFVLVGVYAWFGLTVGLWLVALVRSRSPSVARAGHEGAERLLAAVGKAHQPLLFGGVILWFLQVAPHSILNTVIAVVMTAWMGGQLVAATAAFEQRPWLVVAPSTIAVWAVWLATAGRFLMTRIGHLL